MYLPSDPWPKITTIQFFCILNYIMCTSFLASIQFSYLQEMPCTAVKVRGKWPFGRVYCFAAAKQQLLQYQDAYSVCVPTSSESQTGKCGRDSTAAAVCPYLLINIAVVCSTRGSSMYICMIIHQIHFPWSTRENGKRGSSGWHPQTPAPTCTLAACERQRLRQ